MKILFHCINGLGLGHLSRQVSIATALRRLSSDIQIAFVTSAEEHTWLRNESFLYYFIPSEAHFRVTWAAKENNLSEQVRNISSPIGLNEALFNQISEFWKPDRIVFDTYFTEGMILCAKEREITPIAFFDSIESANYNRQRMDMILGMGGRLIFGCHRGDQIHFNDSQSVFFAGRVLRCFGNSLSPKMSARQKDGKRLIVCLQGGGGFAQENCRFYQKHPSFAKVVVKALCGLHSIGVDFSARFILGPYGKWPDQVEIPQWMEVITFDHSLIQTLAGADLLISTAGYNSVCDSILSACPAIFLPIVHFSEDQKEHITDLVSADLAFSVPHESSKLTKTLIRLFRDGDILPTIKSRLKELTQNNGADRAAHYILE
jgi:UDP:flavonoid glycosyltransferase YjiC (YdhE family)